MKILGLIPARGGSKNVPGKNIKELGGKPLLAFTAEAALASKKLNKVILSSDDDKIIQVAQKYGIDVPFKRPAELAQDNSGSLDVVQHAISFMQSKGEHYDAVCLLQVTSPFRRKGLIDEAIKKFQDGNFDSLVSVLPVPHEYNPHWVFEPDENDELKIATEDKAIIKRRQELPKAYFRDGSIYITKTEVIKQGSLLGKQIGYIVNDSDHYVNIDTLADWEKAERIFQSKFNNS
mgnify:CR=1 FL=1